MSSHNPSLDVQHTSERIRISVDVPLHNQRMAIATGPQAVTLDQWLAVTSKEDFTHTPDYGSVRVRDKLYSFNLRQRKVIAALDTARRNGFPWLDTPTLLECAEMDSGGRVRDIFRGHDAWDVWIVSATAESEKAGTYMLAF